MTPLVHVVIFSSVAVCKSAGITDYRLKDHRHTAAVAMTRAGVPLDLVQRQLGHGDIRQTMVYARFHPEYGDYRRYAAEVESRLAGEKDNGDATKRPTPAAPTGWTGEV